MNTATAPQPSRAGIGPVHALRVLGAIALNTFREGARDRLVFFSLLLTLALIGGSFMMLELSVYNWNKMVTEFGLSFARAGGILMTGLIGAGLLPREFRERTTQLVFSRPVAPWMFVCGKWLGLLAVTLMSLALAGLFVVTVNLNVSSQINTPMPPTGLALYGFALEFAVLAAVSVALSTTARPFVAGVGFALFFVVAQTTWAAKAWAVASGVPAIAYVLTLAPDLAHLNLTGQVMDWVTTPLTTDQRVTRVAQMTTSAIFWTALALGLATVAVRRREKS